MEKKVSAMVTAELARMMGGVDTDEKLNERKALAADAFADLVEILEQCGGDTGAAGTVLHHLAMYVRVLDELYLSEAEGKPP